MKILIEKAVIEHALEAFGGYASDFNIRHYDLITALREALAEQAEQEPVAWSVDGVLFWTDEMWEEWYSRNPEPLYAAPVQQAEQEPVVKPMDKAERENWYKEVIAATEDAIAEKERIAEHRALITRNNAIIAASQQPVKELELTDDEINEVLWRGGPFETVLDATRAVIAADRKKNR